MKILKTCWLACLILFLLGGTILSSCQDEKDNRVWELVEIQAVYVNGEKISTDNIVSDYNKLIITLPPGTDVSRLKMILTPINGELLDFPTDQEHDYTYPMDLRVRSFNDREHIIKMRVISRPLLTEFFIIGLVIPKENIHFSDEGVIIQVPERTDLTKLNVTMGFKNGEISGFKNGEVKDYTDPIPFTITGIDGTVYPYSLMITDKQVGPATIEKVTANNSQSTRVEIDSLGNTQIYFKTLTDFSNAKLNIETGYGNKLLNFTNGTFVNLWNGLKVTIKGTDGKDRQFNILKPKLDPIETFRATSAEMGFATDGGTSLCFSGDYLVVSSHNGTAQGINYYKMDGTKVGTLALPAKVDWGVVYGLRKIASDDKGAIIGVNLAAGGGLEVPFNIYKWKSVTDTQPTILCSYTASILGLPNARSCGVNIQGSIDGNAVITVPISASKIVLKWTIEGGNLVSPTPEKITVDNADNFGNYSSLEQYPNKPNTLVGAIISKSFNGLRTFIEGVTNISISGSSSDLRVKNINGRIYVANCVFGNATHTLRLSDVTAGNEAAYVYNMLGSKATIPTPSNGNGTNDADFGYVNGKLHVAYIGTNGGVVCYALE